MIRISSSFDSGAIEIVSITTWHDVERIDLRIRRDSHQDFTQWFHFRLQGARGRRCVLRFVNAGECTYPGGWDGYSIAASHDRDDWYRMPSDYRDGILSVECELEHDSVWFAYFEPYSWDRHLSFIGRASSSPRVRVVGLGSTKDGHDIDCIDVSDPATSGTAKRKVWVIARQHSGETMAEWFVEGLVERLIDESDPVARAALALADFHIVANMNPDGSVRGNLRTTATGANLNREWLAPSMDYSPEVFLVRERMEATGVDLFIDAHGDEALPYNFVAGSEMLPDFTERQRVEQTAFVAAFKEASPDFQDRHGYAASRYSSDALKLASKWVGHRFGCLSLTLEMPFKDNADAPDARVGWNGARSKRLGQAILLPMWHHLKT
jgi:murein tripeptide amidase MpaA